MPPLNNYLKKNIVIDEIDLNNVYIGLEFEFTQGTEGNWTTIMANALKKPKLKAASRLLTKQS